MFAEEFMVIDPDTALWQKARPLLNVALKLEQQGGEESWHGWQKKRISEFLQNLPGHCTIMAGVWEAGQNEGEERLELGIICEVVRGEIRSLRSFEALQDEKVPAISSIEPGFEHARELMQAVKKQVAPVAWALFTDQATWQEWLFAEDSTERVSDKGELLAALASQGRCVLLGNRAMHHHI